MSEIPKRRRAGLPHNPNVRDLVDGKRRWSTQPKGADAKNGFRGWHERGYLPHRDAPGLVQLVTFRLFDSFPESCRSEWEHLLTVEDHRLRRRQLEDYLDRHRGACYLRDTATAAMIENAFRFFHGKRYELYAWCVMPNHVHVLFKVDSMPMSKIVEDWKKYTAHEANKLLNLSGAFWAADYWDTYMRDEKHELKARCYVEHNPTKAHFVLNPKDWPWSSARFRNELGVLKI